MRRIKRSISYFLLAGFMVFNIHAQTPAARAFQDLDKALADPGQVSSLEFRCEDNALRKFIAHMQQFSQLQSLTLKGPMDPELFDQLASRSAQLPRLNSLSLANNDLQTVPKGVAQISGLVRVGVKGSPDMNIAKFLRQVKKKNNLGILHLEDNQMSNIPPLSTWFPGLERVYITGNQTMNLEKLVHKLKKLTDLYELALPVNQITEIPENIGKLDRLKVLDLRENYISEIPENMSGMDQLVNLSLEGNTITDPVSELEKIATLDIRYLSLDSDLTPEEKERLLELFPNATIREVAGEEEEAADTTSAGSAMAAVDEEPPPATPAASPDESPAIKSGFINVDQPGIRAYSTAYTYYPEFFDTDVLNSPFDSTSFQQRYLDTSYVRSFLANPVLVYPLVKLKLTRKHKKGQLWFEFYREPSRRGYRPFNRYLATEHPELNAFLGMKWVYAGPMDRKTFKRSYIKKKSWIDFRIYYHEPDENFTLELKHRSGFEKILAYPVNRNPKLDEALSRKTYNRRHGRYTASLAKKEKKFHKYLLGKKWEWEKNKERKIESAWNNLRLYMSNKEKQLSRAEWLEYYDKIIADEYYALSNAPLRYDNLVRALSLDSYEVQAAHGVSVRCDTLVSVAAYCENGDLDRLAIKNLLVVNKETRQIITFKGSLGVNPNLITICPDSRYTIVAELRNGNFGVLNEMDPDREGLQRITLELFDHKLTTVGHLRRFLDLD